MRNSEMTSLKGKEVMVGGKAKTGKKARVRHRRRSHVKTMLRAKDLMLHKMMVAGLKTPKERRPTDIVLTTKEGQKFKFENYMSGESKMLKQVAEEYVEGRIRSEEFPIPVTGTVFREMNIYWRERAATNDPCRRMRFEHMFATKLFKEDRLLVDVLDGANYLEANSLIRLLSKQVAPK